MSVSYKFAMNSYALTISAPMPPDDEFITYRSSLSLYDNSLFQDSKRVLALNVHWTYRGGLIRKALGVIDMKVFLQAAGESNVISDDGLKHELLADFKRELLKVGYTGAPVQFDKTNINGRSWLKYQVPVLRVTEYSTGLSESRFLTIRFSFIDNTGEKSPAWYQEASQLMKKIVESMQIMHAE